ncbi:MAG: hypothetical protein HZB26_22745 [Candidatus Hydrogenedentes bacterium]|nr:hypothetical protein [Candidatus Hydrogenedentota bacterium]
MMILKRLGLAMALVAGSVALGAGCATPEARYHALSVFFDGVPEPGAAPAVAPQKTGDAEPAAPAPQFSLHPPYADRKCDLCHENQFSNHLKMEKSLLCGSCHQSDQFTGKVVHGPVSSGNCYACHDPHKSQYPHLLLEEGSAICGRCHTPESFENLERHRSEKGGDCLSCHTPHSGEKERLLK